MIKVVLNQFGLVLICQVGMENGFALLIIDLEVLHLPDILQHQATPAIILLPMLIRDALVQGVEARAFVLRAVAKVDIG